MIPGGFGGVNGGAVVVGGGIGNGGAGIVGIGNGGAGIGVIGNGGVGIIVFGGGVPVMGGGGHPIGDDLPD